MGYVSQTTALLIIIKFLLISKLLRRLLIDADVQNGMKNKYVGT